MKSITLLLKNQIIAFFIIVICSIIFHFPIFKKDLIGVHVWRQSQTQINIQQFYRHDNNIFNPRVNTWNSGSNIQRMEFPLMQWLIAQIERIFGEDIIVTRICIFIIGLLTTLGIYNIVQILFRERILSFLLAWSFTFSPVFYYYTLNPLPDNFALCMAIWSLFYYFHFQRFNSWKAVWASAFFLLLATLAKLPYILFGAVPFFYIIIYFLKNNKQKEHFIYILQYKFIFLLSILPALAWYIWVIPTWNGNGVIKGIFDNQLPWSKTWGILQYHFRVMFPKLLLNYAAIPFFLLGFWAFWVRRKWQQHLPLLMGGLFIIAYFLYEINMIDIVHDYYMMPFLPYLFLVVSYGVYLIWQKVGYRNIMIAYLLILMPYFCYQAVQHYWSLEQTGSNKNLFLYYEDLRKAVPSEERCIILNDISTYVFSYKVDKECYIFWDDYLPAGWIKDMVTNKGVKYMYSDSRKVDENQEVQQYIESVILERGNIRVFKLKY